MLMLREFPVQEIEPGPGRDEIFAALQSKQTLVDQAQKNKRKIFDLERELATHQRDLRECLAG